VKILIKFYRLRDNDKPEYQLFLKEFVVDMPLFRAGCSLPLEECIEIKEKLLKENEIVKKLNSEK